MNKKSLLLVCIVGISALAAAFFVYIRRPGLEAGLHINNEGETGMGYEYHTHTQLTPSQARAKMLANPDAIILDVRTQGEFDSGHIPGAVLLPYDVVTIYAAEVLPDKNAVILVYCRAGRRSEIAARALAAMGYANVYDFGGIDSWPYERE